MGRQIAILLTLADEEQLLELAHEHEFILTTGWLQEADLVSQELRTLPRDREATDYQYDCFLIPRALAKHRHATLVNRTLERPYRIDTSDIPCIEWLRTAYRRSPNLHYDPSLRTRLYVATQWDYGVDQKWMAQVVDLYEALVKLVKRLTVKVQDVWPRYVSRKFGSEFFEVPGLVRSGNVWIMREPDTASA